MKCAQCGTTLEPGELFCGECGQGVMPAPGITQVVAQPVASAKAGGPSAKGICGILVLIIGLILLVGGGLAAWLWFGDDLRRMAQSSNQNSNKRTQPRNENATTDASPLPTPQTNRNRANSNQGNNGSTAGWGPRNERASINGENLTYYGGTTPEQCQADCDKNPSCKAFTFIRPGAYKAGDPAMCYQISVVREVVTHDCCISGVKTEQ